MRTHRLWTQPIQAESVTFTNDRRENWIYDNERHVMRDYDAHMAIIWQDGGAVFC